MSVLSISTLKLSASPHSYSSQKRKTIDIEYNILIHATLEIVFGHRPAFRIIHALDASQATKVFGYKGLAFSWQAHVRLLRD